MRKPNYDKFPATRIQGEVIKGWQDIIAHIVASASQEQNIAIELYTGVYEKEVIDAFEAEFTNRIINVRDVMKAEQEIIAMTERYMTDDVLFGYVTPLTIDDYFDTEKLVSFAKSAKELGMENTHFDNCTGLDDTTDTHLTTAYDIALMSRELLKYDFIKEYTDYAKNL